MNKILAFAIAGCLAACGGTAAPEPSPPSSTTSTTTTMTTTKPNPAVGAPVAQNTENEAPNFSLKDLDGNQVQLSSFRGKLVVLEWFNPGCPFVKYAYNDGPLAGMAKQKSDAGIVWLSINSGAPGKQGNGRDANRKAAKAWDLETPILIDESGEVGKMYGAKTTPHLFVINEAGSIVYKGALDNAPLGRAPAEGHINYVEAALADLSAGRAVQVSETKSYGCSVKY